MASNTHLVTGYAGSEHVTSADEGAYHAAVLGTGQYVLDVGDKLSASIISNNKVRISNGDALMQGRYIRVNPNTYEECTFDNGAQGYKRNDLIVMRYTKNASTGIEDANIVVIKGTPTEGTPSDPTYTTGDIVYGNATVNDFPLYRVTFDGLNIQPLVKLFTVLDTWLNLRNNVVEELYDEIDSICEDVESQLSDSLTNLVKVTVSFSDEQIGDTITATKGETILSKTVPETKELVFGLPSVGEWTFTDTSTEEVMVKEIQYYGEYTLSFSDSGGYKGWLEAAGITTEFDSLDEVLADEKTVRTLMTKHDSVDYLVEWLGEDDTLLTTIIASANAMKWIGLRDYAYDSLSAYHSQFLASTNWEYILKDKVPTMTSNSAPYGEAIRSDANNSTTQEAFNAFTNNTVNWTSANTSSRSSGKYVGYKFTNPTKVTKVKFETSGNLSSNILIQASNDNSTWNTLKTFSNDTSSADWKEYSEVVDNDNYYLYYRVYFENNLVYYNSKYFDTVRCLQFYGRSLNVSVPTMTSNTSPFGEIFTDSTSDWDNNATDIYKAFDNNNADWAGAIDGHNNVTLGYDFGDDVVVKAIVFDAYVYNAYRLKNYKIQGSNNKTTWTDVHSGIATELSSHKLVFVAINNSTSYRYYRLVGVDSYGSSVALAILQFYGVSHSEYSNRHWIYDNGVEVETLTTYTGGSGTTIKNSGDISVSRGTDGSDFGSFLTNDIDLSSYDLMRVVVSNTLTGTYFGEIAITTKTNWESDAKKIIDTSDSGTLPYNVYLDISSINDNKKARVSSQTTHSSSGALSVKEWWLE